MDLTAPIIYNGITAQPVTAVSTGGAMDGIQIDAVDISTVSVDGYMDPASATDGMSTGDVYTRARTISISGSVFGSTSGRLWSNVQSVLHAFHPSVAYDGTNAYRTGQYRSGQGFSPFRFRMPTTNATYSSTGYIPMAVYARPLAPPSYRVERMSDSAARGSAVRFSVTLVAADPRKYYYADSVGQGGLPLYSQQDAIAYVPTTATTTIDYMGGNYWSWPWVKISSSTMTSIGTLTIVVDTSSVAINCAVLANSTTYYLDYESRRLYTQSGTTITDFSSALSTSSVFTQVRSTSTYSFSSTASLSTASRFYICPAWA